MKQSENRQKKFISKMKPARTPSLEGGIPLNPDSGERPLEWPGAGKGGSVYGLISNLVLAAKLAQSAKHCHLGIHNFDKAADLAARAKQKLPILVVLDWEGREAEAFSLLKAFSGDPDLRGVPVIGCVPQEKGALKEEARRAGCLRVYLKSEFHRSLNDILLRYAS